MPINAIQPSFAGGEFAPTLYSRVDLQRYGTGLRKALNAFIHPHGGASNRAGIHYIASTKDHLKKAIVVSFEFSTTQAYVIEFGHLYARFYKDGGQIISGTPVEVVTPYTEDDLARLKFRQSADVLYIMHPLYNTRTLTRTSHTSWTMGLFVNKNGPFMLQNITTTTINPAPRTWLTGTVYAVGDFVSTDSTTTYQCVIAHTAGTFSTDLAAERWVLSSRVIGGTLLTLTASAATFNALHVGALWQVIHEMPSQKVSTTLSTSPAVINSTPIICGATWRFTSTGTWTGFIYVEKSIDAGATWTLLRTTEVNIDTFGSTGEEQCLIRVRRSSGIATPENPTWTGSAVTILSSDEFDWYGVVKITAFTSTTVVTATAEAYTLYNFPVKTWAEGSWSDYRGYPHTATFYQDRLCFGPTDSEPQTAWLSKTSNFTDFGRSRPLVDSDGITTRLPSQKVNIIKNLVSLGDILALTSSEDWIITSSTGVMTPTTANARPQGFRGSSGVEPVTIGSRCIAVQPMGQTMRDLAFSLEADGLTGENISVVSSHLFEGHTIVSMAYAQEPDSLVYAVRSDGKMLTLTYLREQEVLAWTLHETDGSFESVCTIPGNGYNEVWAVVKRTVGGATKRFIERFARRMASTDPRQQFFVDSGLSLDDPKTITGATQANPVVITSAAHGFSNGDLLDLSDFVGMTDLNGRRVKVKNASANTFELTDDDDTNINGTGFGAYASGGKARKAVTSVTGLSHLEGKTVSILGNGSVYPQKVVTGGAVSLSPAASIVHVGLPYVSEIETLNIELPQRDGSLQGRKVKINEVIVRVLNSRGMKIGPSDGSVMDDLTLRTGEKLGDPMNLFSGDAIQTFQGGYEDFGRVLIRQSDPLPMTVASVIPRVTPGG